MKRTALAIMYFLAEESQAWMTWEIREVIRDLIAPIAEVPKRTPAGRDNLP